ncbi:hypothetical protein Nmel_015155 [Mimus melanotis]
MQSGSGWRCHITRGCAQLPQHLLPSHAGPVWVSLGQPMGSALVEVEAKFLGSNARICAFAGRHKGLCFFYSSRNKRLVVVVAFVCWSLRGCQEPCAPPCFPKCLCDAVSLLTEGCSCLHLLRTDKTSSQQGWQRSRGSGTPTLLLSQTPRAACRSSLQEQLMAHV